MVSDFSAHSQQLHYIPLGYENAIHQSNAAASSRQVVLCIRSAH